MKTGLALFVALGGLSANATAQGPLRATSVETLTGELDGGTGGISVDADGNIYVADFGSRLGGGGTVGSKIFVITPGGESRIFAEGFGGGSGNEIDLHGQFYQSNIRTSVISKVDREGIPTDFVSEGISTPVGIASDNDGNLFVANCGSGSIQKVTPAGVSTRFAASPLLKCPNGVAFDDDGNLYAANFENGDVVKITPDATVSRLATLAGGNNGHLIYHEGFLYVVDRAAHQIFSVSLSGEVELLAGSGVRGRQNGDPMNATFSLPNDIGISPDGRTLYVNEVAAASGPNGVLAPMIVRAIRVSKQK